MAGEYQIPFDPEGNQLHFPDSWKAITWQDNFEFQGPIKVTEMRRGRSAAYFVVEMSPFVSPDPLAIQGWAKGTMFMTDFLEAVLRNGANVGGLIPGLFTFVKRGQNYGVKLV